MSKKMKDIKLGIKNEINLRKKDNFSKLKEKLRLKKKKKHNLNKRESPINKIKDIKGKENEKYIYIRRKNFSVPKYLGNLMKIAFFGFLIIFFINSVNIYFKGKNIKKELTASALEGYSSILNQRNSTTKIQFQNAQKVFDNAAKSLEDLEKELWFFNTDNSIYSNGDSIASSVKNLLEGGKHFALSGTHFLNALEEFNKIPLYFVSLNSVSSFSSPSISEALNKGLIETEKAIKQISLASEQIQNINDKIIPAHIRARVDFARDKIQEISDILDATAAHFPAILKLLGDRYPHKFLILLQNNNELRPSGGFIGTYALLDINDGFIENLEIHDVYDIDGSYGGIIEPPEEFKTFTSNWRFRDSNYSSDFPTSAKKARWFLEKEGGPTVDTVIAINQGLLKDMLEITGPIQVGDFGSLDSLNYNLLLSYIIESKAWGAEDPKHILKVFIPEFKKAILKEENLSKVSGKIYKAVQQKHIMMYSSDDDIQALFDSLGVSGRVYKNKKNEDYLSVINISTGGTKSDQFVEESILHETEVQKDGTLIDEITVKREHHWSDDIYFEWKKELAKYGITTLDDQVLDILGRGRNMVSMRIYVPYGSEIITTNNENLEKKYDKDLKKNYFFTRMEIYPGETEKIYVKYKLPYKLKLGNKADLYKLFIEKQPGSRGSIFTKTLTTEDNVEVLDVFPYKDYRIDGTNRIIYPTNLVYDRYFSAVFK